MPLALAWALAFVLAEDLDRLWKRLAIPEGNPLHTIVEEAGTPLLVLALCAVIAYGAVRRWPNLLRLPASVSTGAVFVRLLAFALLSAVVLAVVVGVAWYFLVLPGEDPNHSQYGVSLAFAIDGRDRRRDR